MFNNKASDTERQKKLEDLIKADNEESDDENEVPDDDQLNEMISRSDSEFQMFQEMDRKRYKEENKEVIIKEIMERTQITHQKHINYRLIQEYEVPEWVKIKPKIIKDEEIGNLGKRERKRVNYAEKLTDSQFTKIIEEGGDLHAELEKSKHSNVVKC